MKIVRTVVAYVLYLQEVSDLHRQVATSSSIAIALKELNDEGSHITVFRGWNNVSTTLHDQTTQTVDLGGSDQDDTIIKNENTLQL